jgi:hypothetical protein
MGETTVLTLNSSKRASLRTTVPMSIVRQWNLKPKDKLYWQMDIVNGKMVVVVNRFEDQAQQKITKREVKKKK